MKIVSIDIGTVNIKATLVDYCEEYGIKIEDYHVEPSEGVKYGSIVDVDLCGRKVLSAIDKIRENNPDISIDHYVAVYNGKGIKTITGEATKDFWSEGNGQNVKITGDMIDEIIEDIVRDYRSEGDIIHKFPQEYVVDDSLPTKNPIGITGRRLKASVKIVIDKGNHSKNLKSVMERCDIEDFLPVYAPVALSEAVVNRDLKNGSIIVELGGGTSTVVIWYDKVLREVSSLPLGSNHITQDIKIVLQTELEVANRAKEEYGVVCYKDVEPEIKIDIDSAINRNGEGIQLQFLGRVIEARLSEIYELMIEMIYKTRYQNRIDSAVIMTGESLLIRNSDKLLQEMVNVDTEWGTLKGVESNINQVPEKLFVSIGAVKFGIENNLLKEIELDDKPGFFGKVKDFFKDLL